MISEKGIQLIANNDFFAAIAFLSPRSPQWPLVRGLCMQADAIAEEKGNLTVAFLKKRESIQLFAAICDIAQDWKSAHIFIQKQKISYVFSVKWLSCYLKSLQCEDKLAWCISITKGPRRLNDFRDMTYNIIIETTQNPIAEQKPEEIFLEEHFICPCRNLSAYNWGQRELPSPLKYQLQAFAVAQGYADCPNFNIEEFRPVFRTNTVN